LPHSLCFAQIWLSEKARRSVERARARHIFSEREFAHARRRERGDGKDAKHQILP
jgi:hypothetical protein